MIGLIVAMDEEIELLLEKLHKDDYEKHDDIFHYYKFKIEEREIVGVVSGVGKIRASAATEFLLSNFEISKVLNFGMAGGIDQSIEIGDILNIEKSYDYDEDLSAFGKDKVKRELERLQYPSLKYGIGVSGDKFVNDRDESENINKEYSALCYEMELSAISLVCNIHNIPVYSIKYISDKADENADVDFYESLKMASEKFGEILLDIINQL